jgi:uncharacterized protein (DUF885 family)
MTEIHSQGSNAASIFDKENFVKKLIILGLFLACTVSVGCRKATDENQRFENLAKEYIEKLLERQPELATMLGNHRYDNRLNDYSLSAVANDIEFYRNNLQALSGIDTSQLGEVNRIDCEILRDNIQQGLYQMEVLKDYQWNPLFYNTGNSVYLLLARDFAPLRDRLRSVMARLQELPKVLECAKSNLQNPPRIHVETAILQNKGNINMVKIELNSFLDKVPELKPEFTTVQAQAAAVLEAYGTWLEKDLLPRANGDFRIGLEKFRQKLRYTLESDISPEEILRQGQDDLKTTQEALFETALPLYRKSLSKMPEANCIQDKKRIIKVVLDRLAGSYPSNETIVGQAKQALVETTDFVRKAQLVTMLDEPLKVIVMPEFQRGVAVAYCDSPGPLEPRTDTFFAISPTPSDWPPTRVVSFFREYNDYMLQDLTIHEAMPGHYLQLAHSHRFKAPTLVRAIFSSGPFVEGWATYAEQIMVEKGYGGPEVKMQQLKMRLRMIINAILDQKIQTAAMTEKEAMDLMRNEGFQEEGEAAGKWRRACLTSTQLSTYYVGNLEINDIRKAYETKHGPIGDLKAFHDRLLSYGSPAPKYLRQLMGL